MSAPLRLPADLLPCSIANDERLANLLTGIRGDPVRSCLERLRELVSLKDLLCWTLSGRGLGIAPVLSAFPLWTDLISLCGLFRSGSLFACPRGSGNNLKSSEKSSPSSRARSGGCVLRRIFCDADRIKMVSSIATQGGNP